MINTFDSCRFLSYVKSISLKQNILKAKFLLGGGISVLFTSLLWFECYIGWIGISLGSPWKEVCAFGLSLVVLLIPLWCALDHWVFRPLICLILSYKEVARGNLESAIISDECIPKGEFGTLMRNRNAVLGKLLSYQQNLLEKDVALQKAHDELERQVEKRTSELMEKNKLLTASDEVAQMVLSSLDQEQVLDNLARQFIEVGIFRSLMIALVDEQARRVQVVRSVRLEEQDFSRLSDPNLKPGALDLPLVEIEAVIGYQYDLDDNNITAEVARTGEMRIVENWADERLDRRFDRHPEEWKEKVAYFIPVKQEDKVLAVLATGSLQAEKAGMIRRIEMLHPLLAQMAIALEHAQLYSEALAKRQLEVDLALAERIEQYLLPEKFPEIEGFEVTGMSRPHLKVGGDYFDVLEDGMGRIWIALGDVSGKGIPAALTMATLQGLFRGEVEWNQPLPEVMCRLTKGMRRCTTPETFATLCFGVLDPVARTFTYVNAGHPYPLLVQADGGSILLEHTDMPLGLFPSLIESLSYEEHQVTLNPGDTLVMYSDGVTEAGAQNQGMMFGEDRLKAVVTEHRAEGVLAIQEAIFEAVDAFMEGTPVGDDVTLVVIGQ